ncbi:Uncharacterised protein [Mycobacteroides abscessus subsp. abscessus]|nr:Uncharacterised protein [Mycobacteroides abscessus subsp. abscessus]
MVNSDSNVTRPGFACEGFGALTCYARANSPAVLHASRSAAYARR